MAKTVRCAQCRFARRSRAFSDKGWSAYQCRNRESEYFRALLNVSANGDEQHRITWKGCPLGERRDAR
ncbi:hypothetical protein LJC74_03640 [Eubacteriales bacterium OttesenSCG-928-A19]|nr:hypothetical protein [Eubacteriales bacterium OttesenSCG-928-A19]